MLGAALLLGAPARAADPAELESKLTVTVDGVEKTLSLEEAQQALHIPSVSLALIDQDSIAFARAYGENATPNTLVVTVTDAHIGVPASASGSGSRSFLCHGEYPPAPRWGPELDHPVAG